MFDWLKGKSAPVPSAVPSLPTALQEHRQIERQNPELMARINARFPPSVVFRLPIYDLSDCYNNSQYYEDPRGWKRILDLFPTPPKTAAESSANEAYLWEWFISLVSTKDSQGHLLLWPRQSIIEFFKNNEKWIFRYYYAATGTVYKTIQEKFARLNIYFHKISQEIDANPRAGGNPYIAQLMQQQNKINLDLEYVVYSEMPAHFDKWGNWFLFNVQEAFDKRYKTESGYGPQSATSPAHHPAHDDLPYKPNT